MAKAFAISTTFTALDRITAPIRKMQASMKGFGAASQAAMKRASGASSGFMGSLAGMIPLLSVAGIIAFGNECITAFQDSGAAIANVEAGLLSTKNAIGMTSDELAKMASYYQDITFFEDDAILNNLTAQLLTFGGVGKQNLDRVQMAAMDLTAKLKGVDATGEDLQGFAIKLGKAMDNPTKNITALSRSGVMFTDQQKNMIKALQDSGDMLGAQNIILAEIENKYGGTAKALAKTDKGMQAMAKNKLGSLMEDLGKNLVPIKMALLEIAIALMPILTLFSSLAPILPVVVGGFVAYYGITQAIIALQAAKAFFLMVKGIYATSGAMGVLNTVMAANPVAAVIIGLTALVAIGVLVYKNWDVIKEKFSAGIGYIGKKFGEFFNWIGQKLPAANAMWHSFGATLMLILGPIGLLLNAIISIANWWDRIKAAFAGGGILAGIKTIGYALIDALLIPMQQLLGLFAKIPGLGSLASAAAAKISDVRKGMAGDADQMAVASTTSTTTSRSTVDVNVNAPKNTTVKQKGKVPGVTVNRGAAY